jgi:hypothetical protein
MAAVGANGGWTYGSSFPVAGTAPGALTLYAIAWNNAYANPYQAAAANSEIGWSSTFSYTLASQIGTPPNMGISPFGIAVPEPGMMALAALGVAVMILRRRSC